MQNKYIENKIALIKKNINDTEKMFCIIDDIFQDGVKEGLDDSVTRNNITFVTLLEEFIEDCGLDRIEACKQAQKLLALLNE